MNYSTKKHVVAFYFYPFYLNFEKDLVGLKILPLAANESSSYNLSLIHIYMSLKDRFDKFIDYFTEDGEDVSTAYQPKAEEPIVTPVPSVQELPQQAGSTPSKDKNITRLHARQQELAMQSQRSTDKMCIRDSCNPV